MQSGPGWRGLNAIRSIETTRVHHVARRRGGCVAARGSRAAAGDAANVILSAVGYNLRLVLAWLRIILRVILLALLQTFTIRPALKPAS
jgi:IS5 family transposase